MRKIVFDFLKKFTKWILGSFDVTDDGSSAKKLTAFAFMVLVGWLHIVFVDKNNALEFLIVDVSAILTLLGVATIDKLQQMKNKDHGEPQP